MTCCRSEEQQHNTRPGEHQQHNSSNKSGEQQHSSRSGVQQHNSSSRSGEQQHPSNSIAEERQHLNSSSRVEDHRLHHHHINRKSIRFTRDVEPEEDRNESAAGIRIHIQVRWVCHDPAGIISVLWIRVQIRRFRMFCGPPSQRSGSGSF
jgi:hypothetical protein